ncbi:MAG TPA: SMC family ATPase [Gemmataceae bacterium]|nr:SMC family ATPase [Gemmataceae bacterium]
MIPQRVYLRGFLSYRDEQEVRFDGSSLWMLSGLNGSGKSSVFDAVTYALFGHHRGGRQEAQELINKDSTGAVVEFDFTQDGESYRARRTLQRDAKGGARGTQQILRWQPGADGPPVPVEDTGRRSEFDKWVREHIGLNFETFTSSVLLLQGRAEKLLDSTAKGRFEVLAGIVDLERYQKLHEKADGQRKALKLRAEILKNQLSACPEVSELELVVAENRIADAQEQRQQAKDEVERWQGLEFQAKRWGELQTKLGGLRQKWRQAQSLVAEAEAIETDMARLQKLREALPHVEAVFKQKQQGQQAETKIATLTRERGDFKGKVGERTEALDRLGQRRSLLQQKIAADDRRLHEVGAELTKLATVLERAKQYERQKQTLARQEEELARLPADTHDAVEAAARRWEELTAFERALPLLERLHGQREALRKALATEAAEAKKEQAVKTTGEKLRADHEERKKRAAEATKARERAEQELAAAQALFRQLQADWEDFTALEGARLCRACGQPLTSAHFEQEKAKREKEIADARARNEKAATAQRAASKAEQALLKEVQELASRLEAAREEYRDARDAAQQARKDAERCRDECGSTWGDLHEPFHSRVAPAPPDDWLQTAYPGGEEVAAVRREAKGLDAARRALRDAEGRHRQWVELNAGLATTRTAMKETEAELPRDVGALRRKHVGFETEQKTLADTLKAARDEDRALGTDAECFQKERDSLRKQQADREAKIKGEEATREACLKSVAAALKALSADWQQVANKAGLAEVHTLSDEKEQLEARGTEARFKELEGARHGVEALRQHIVGIEGECEQVPPDARRDLRDVQTLLRQARHQYDERDRAHRQAERERESLVGQKKQREQLQAQALEVAKEYKVLEQLADLLGRDRLQLYLVRQAERQIVDHANAVLDRLSGGQLYLRLRGGEEGDAASEQALELEASNRTTGGQPINVAFLSGSQRFRVAVSLALGIGQYASRQHRPIESVIIDEGFGCLDRNGRQVMIQELQNLRGQLHCILLVSHQEEFADAFNDGYHFELNEGSTRVTRIQR